MSRIGHRHPSSYFSTCCLKSAYLQCFSLFVLDVSVAVLVDVCIFTLLCLSVLILMSQVCSIKACIVFPGGERNCGVHELICIRKGKQAIIGYWNLKWLTSHLLLSLWPTSHHLTCGCQIHSKHNIIDVSMLWIITARCEVFCALICSL